MFSTQSSDDRYHVFLSHHGKDVKDAFVSHLYGELDRLKFRVFLDKMSLQVGENWMFKIEEAIASAFAHVVIFSPNFASSPSCLNELVQILESGAPIIPVLYHVQTSDLRWASGDEGWFAHVLEIIPWLTTSQQGVYASKLRVLGRKTTYDADTHRYIPRHAPEIIKKWIEALSRAANIENLELEKCDWDEGDLVEEILQRVEKFVREAAFPLPKYLIGLNNQLDEFKKTISRAPQLPGLAKVVGVLGSGGTGKSTTLKEFFNRYKSDYERSSFSCYVRKYPLIDVLRNLVKDLTSYDLKIDNIADGIEKLSRLRALVVFDDVDNVEKLDALLPTMRAVLHPNSLIVLITRNQNIFSGLKDISIYEMRGLDPEQSKNLFCWYAFHQACPFKGCEKIVEDFLDGSTGLVLSLKVLGAFIFGNNSRNWKDKVDNISKLLPSGIPRWILFDIACVILGEDRNTSIQISLQERSLVFTNHEKLSLTIKSI